MQQYPQDLEKLVGRSRVARGKDILGTLCTEIHIRPDGTAEIAATCGRR